MAFVREKKIYCGEYAEVDIIPIMNNAEQGNNKNNNRRKKVTRLAQKNLNDKNSKRFLTQLANGNFSEKDLFVSLTYNEKYLPESDEVAGKEIRNFLNRLGRRMKKLDKELKYILVTESGRDEDTGHITRVHHHLIINGGLDRDEIEKTWSKGRGKKAELIGYVNTRRLQANENGFEGLTKYMTKGKKNRKKWSSSRNLERPTPQPPNDHKYTRRKIEKLANSNDLGREVFEKKYPKYDIVEVKPVYYELTGWHVYLKMWKKPIEMRC